ncbi:MAG: GyrI-like domain-containing protein [Actinomycetota bacterium]|nr:GyrI-like domain-containing protein [Actinomycetota bacterium]
MAENDYEIHVENRDEQPAVVVRGHVGMDEIGAFIGDAFTRTLAGLTGEGLAPTGPPFALYSFPHDGIDLAAGFPCPPGARGGDEVALIMLPAGQVATTMHVGPYADVAGAYNAITSWMSANGMVATGASWESYLDGPEVPMPRTVVCAPCRPADEVAGT